MGGVFFKFLHDEEAATSVEYGIVAAMILAVIVGIVTAIGSGQSNKWQRMHDDMTTHGM